MDSELLKHLARHQAWADAEHWKTLRGNAALLEDADIRKRLNHMTMASEMLAALARGEAPNFAGMKERESMDEVESAMRTSNESLAATVGSADLDKMITTSTRAKRTVRCASGRVVTSGADPQPASPRPECITNARAWSHTANDGLRFLVCAGTLGAGFYVLGASKPARSCLRGEQVFLIPNTWHLTLGT